MLKRLLKREREICITRASICRKCWFAKRRRWVLCQVLLCWSESIWNPQNSHLPPHTSSSSTALFNNCNFHDSCEYYVEVPLPPPPLPSSPSSFIGSWFKYYSYYILYAYFHRRMAPTHTHGREREKRDKRSINSQSFSSSLLLFIIFKTSSFSFSLFLCLILKSECVLPLWMNNCA